MRPVTAVATALLIGAIGLLLGGCAATHEMARDFTVMNQPDVFELHYGTLQNFSNRKTFTWTNMGTKAQVRQASSVKEGNGSVEIRNPAGHVVHSKSLRELGSFLTGEGTPGPWKITVVLEGATGSVTLEVRKSG